MTKALNPEVLKMLKPAQDAQPAQGAVHLRACEWLSAALADGPQPESQLATMAKADHLSKACLRGVKAALGVKSVRQDKHWVWTRPTLSAVSKPMPPETIGTQCPACGKKERLFVRASPGIEGEPDADTLICGACGHRETPAA